MSYSNARQTLNQWSLLTIVFSKTDQTLYQYINGDLEDSTGPTSGPWSQPAPREPHLVLGADYYTDTSTYMGGGFDGLLISEEPMTVTEVKDLYEGYSVTEPDKYASSKV